MSLDPKWKAVIDREAAKDYFIKLKAFVKDEREKYTVNPAPENVFKALALTPYDKVKVVILGQDPYPNPGDSHGLAFSSMSRITPASLYNIYEEVRMDWYKFKKDDPQFPFNGNNLTQWAVQGVLLLNTILTVRAQEPASHKGKGWETFTAELVAEISKRERPVVFMLWGNTAKEYSRYIDKRHLILEAAHPSPKSAEKGFFGCKHFSQANKFINSLHSYSDWEHLAINWGTWPEEFAKQQYNY